MEAKEKRMKRLFVGLICSALICGAAVAGPSLNGPTGLIVMPTADTLEFGEAEGFFHYVDYDEDEGTVFGANAGIGMGIELGLASLHNGDSETFVNAKWNFMKETSMSPGIAIGAIDLTGSIGDVDPYIVLSKKLSVPESSVGFSGHVGYIGGDIEELMIGASADITPKIQIAADYISDFTELGVGVRYAVTDDLKLGVSSVDGDMMLSVSYRFGFK